MNNIVKSVVFAAVVLFAGIAAMQVIYKNQDTASDITAVEPAAGEATTTEAAPAEEGTVTSTEAPATEAAPAEATTEEAAPATEAAPAEATTEEAAPATEAPAEEGEKPAAE